MFKALFFIGLSWSAISGAAVNPATFTLDGISNPVIAAEKVGIYRAKISTNILKKVRRSLILAFKTEDRTTPPEVRAFDDAVKRALYPHPSKISGDAEVWNMLRQTLFKVRAANKLSMFDTTKYETLDACKTAFEGFVLEQLPGEVNATKRAEICGNITEKLTELNAFSERQKLAYSVFYRSAPRFSQNVVESYIKSIIPFDGVDPLNETQEKILSILVDHGFLEILGEIKEGKLQYNPRNMVEKWVGANGAPKTIILGCGHSDIDEMLEFFGLPRESWCGACKDVPHTEALVVSLDESSADVLCDLNHPDLWAPLTEASADVIRDETWSLDCYTSETLDSIARVLKVGGEFSSNGYSPSLGIKSQMEVRGFEIIEEDAEKRTLRMRKV